MSSCPAGSAAASAFAAAPAVSASDLVIATAAAAGVVAAAGVAGMSKDELMKVEAERRGHGVDGWVGIEDALKASSTEAGRGHVE